MFFDASDAVSRDWVPHAAEAGASIWMVGPSGLEEWLFRDSVDAGGGAPIATWHVDGASVRPRENCDELLDNDGTTQREQAAFWLMQRLGVPRAARRYFTLHATLDLQHSEAWNREVLRPLIAQDPRAARAIAEGALMRLRAGARCFARYREEFRLQPAQAAQEVAVAP